MPDGEANATGNAENGNSPARIGAAAVSNTSIDTSERNCVLEGQAPAQMAQVAQTAHVDQMQGTATAAAPTTSPTNEIMKGTDHAAAAAAAQNTNKEDDDTFDLALDEEDMMEIEMIAEEDQKKEAAQGKGSASNSAAGGGTSAATTANVGKEEAAVDTAGNDAKGEKKRTEESEASSKVASEPEPANKAASSSAGDGSTRSPSMSGSKKDGNDDSNQKRESAGSAASKEIEVLDPALNYQQVRVLKSVSEGDCVMGVSRHMLSKVCDLGGGVIKSEKFGTGYFYRYHNQMYADAAAAPPAVAPKENTGSNVGTSEPMQKTAVAKQPHLSAAVLKRHNDSHQKQQEQQQQQQQPEKKTGKQTEPAVASTQFYGGTFPYYSSVSGPPPPGAIGYLNASILRATTAAAAAPRQAQPSVRRPSASTSTAASTARMVTYSAYPPTKFPSVEEIEASIPADASSIFHIMDRRINFDNYTKDASFYSLLRGWVQDDPYRCNPLMNGQLFMGGDWAQVDGGHTSSVERPKKRGRVNDESVDVLALLQKQQGNTEQPTLLELRSEHVARAKKIHAEARKLDQLKMANARESLGGRYGITL